jgi:flap endonuclease-1
LTNEAGEITSHLMGMFYRTIRMVDNGIKPVYVFDGKPPTMKAGELEKRTEKREVAQAALEKAKEDGDMEEVDKQSRRLVKVTKEHVEEVKVLLGHMGIPWVQAPCEAEAQCAELAKAGKVYAVGTEDMDALTFGTPVLLRHLTFSEARKMPIKEFHLSSIMEGFEMNPEQFVDLCILLGCDYVDKIKGIGPKKAIELVRKHGDIETILGNLDTKKYPTPENWLFTEARRLFKSPEVTPAAEIDLKWEKPNEEELVKFMCGEKGFQEDRIRKACQKLVKARGGATQGRLDSFFKVLPSPTSGANKRKAEESKGKGSAKKPSAGAAKKGVFKR